MNIINYTPSPKFKELCYKYLQFFEDNNVYDVKLMQDILGKETPLPILYFATDLLYRNNLIKFNQDLKFYKPTINKNDWEKALNNLKISNAAIQNFEENIKHTSYIMPATKKITFRELTEEEYLKKSEFFDYEFASLFVSTGTYNSWWMDTDYLNKSFAVTHNPEYKGKKKHYIFVAESGNSVLGYISISNYIKGVDLFFNHNLPCKDEEIFYVNYIQTRQEAQRRHLATALLGYALNEVFYKDNAYAVSYEAICEESEMLLNKVSGHMNLEVYKRKYETSQEYKKYGSLKGHIITRKEEPHKYFDFLEDKEYF